MATGMEPDPLLGDEGVAMDADCAPVRRKTERDLELEMDDEYVIDLQSK